ncbi:MAG: cation diffusion facilitator family transporter [Hyphomicrobiaceae bacterium]|nr:cation diffusion facilitator family transporter [Hyphomicrobiaceae bacterium]
MSWALALTGSFLVAEVIGGIVTGSLALISDAAHMMTDTIGLAIALAAIKIAARPADSRRTFGYQRFEVLAAAFNAVLLFGVAGYILYEGAKRFIEPPQVQTLGMLVIATLGLLVNLIAMRLLNAGKDSSLNVKGAYLEVWSDLLGSIGVIGAAIVIWLTGWTWIDAVVAIGIGLWVLPRTWTLLKETTNVLLEGVPDGIDLDAVAVALKAIPNVRDLHDLHVWALTSDSPSLSAHLVGAKDVNAESVRAQARAILKEQFHIEHVTLQVEDEDCRINGVAGAVH